MSQPPYREEALEYLMSFLTDHRRELFLQKVAQRSRYIVPVLECLIDEQNVNAVIRTAESLGLQQMSVIENQAKMKPARSISKGSHHWMEISKFKMPESRQCIQNLKEKGYRIIVSSPHENGHSPDDLPLDQPIALVMGAEGPGISEEMKQMADGFLQIPMYGFTESYNISVAAAMSLYTLVQRLKQSRYPWPLQEQDAKQLLWKWTCRTVREADKLLQRFAS